MKEQKITLRYSRAIKQKVVKEIENGKLTIPEAKRLYDIKGGATIQTWLKKLGKAHLLNKVIHIQMKDEPDKIKQLEKQKQELESALAKAHLKIITLESTVRVLEEKSDAKLKKKDKHEIIQYSIHDKRFKEGKYTIVELCSMLNITRQGFYKNRELKANKVLEEEVIIELVNNIRHKQPRIGGRKLHRMLKADLRKLSLDLGRDKFFDLLRRNKLLVQPEKQYVRTTNSFHRFRIYSNLIKEIKIESPNQVFVADITYIRLKGGFCYLFLVTDVYSRKIVGYALREDLSTEGAVAAISTALKQTGSIEGLIHHSDRGIQYCSDNYIKLLQKRGIKISMGEAGNPYDNAIAERVNGILKNEFYLNGTFRNYQDAERATKEAIKTYNNLRPHMSLGYLTPEQKYAA